MNDQLLDYIRNNIFPIYHNNDEAHDINHIEYVIQRSLGLSNNQNVNLNMIYAIAAYHDIGCYIDRENHEVISAKIFADDKEMHNFFDNEQIKIIEEAIEDHRASLEYEPRSIYGKIVSSADRNTSIEMSLRRSHDFQIKNNPKKTAEEFVDDSFQKLNNKFGIDGYAKMYVDDKLYIKFLIDIRRLLNDKEKFRKKYKSINHI